MSDYKLVEDKLDVPKSTGVEGFVHTIREILKLPRVQSVNIDSKGRINYKRYILEGEQHDLAVDFEGLQPWAIVRNSDVEEITADSYNAAIILVALLDCAARDNLHPIAFVLGANSNFWNWYTATTGFAVTSKTNICGLPIYNDRHLPDSVLVLCAGFTAKSALIDTQKAYKVEMSILAPQTQVEVF